MFGFYRKGPLAMDTIRTKITAFDQANHSIRSIIHVITLTSVGNITLKNYTDRILATMNGTTYCAF